MAEAGSVVKSGFRSAVGLFLEYDTPKIVHIRSKKVGIINRLLQLLIIAYIVGYAIVWEKGYQEFDDVVSAASTKVKGVTYTNLSGVYPGVDHRIWDVADYVIPPQENDAFFVMTNAIVTVNQTQTTCLEDPSNSFSHCTSDDECPQGKAVINGDGVHTGKCKEYNTTLKICEIYAWCPVEQDNDFPIKNKALLEDSSHFTVLIKNQIEFPKFEKKRRNVLENYNKSYLTTCRYDADNPIDRFCPIFELGYIINQTNETYEEIAIKGGFVSINIKWDCNLDFDISDCKPQYTFRRLDDKESQIAPGWNFRYANFYYEDGVYTRDLIKAFGIRFVIKVTGRAGKFSIVPLLLNLGSGIGLLAIATVLCDMVTLYCLKRGDFYKEKKYLYVTGDDAFNSNEDSWEHITRSDPENGAVSQGSTSSRDTPRSNEKGGLLEGESNQRSYNSTDPVSHNSNQAGNDAAENQVTNRRPGQYKQFENEDDD